MRFKQRVNHSDIREEANQTTKLGVGLTCEEEVNSATEWRVGSWRTLNPLYGLQFDLKERRSQGRMLYGAGGAVGGRAVS